MLEQSCLLLFLDLKAAGSSGSCCCILQTRTQGRDLGARLRERVGFSGLVEGWQHQGDDTKHAQCLFSVSGEDKMKGNGLRRVLKLRVMQNGREVFTVQVHA